MTTEVDGAVTEAGGALPDSVTVLDDQYPGVANLDPDLLEAMREAATGAADDGIEFYVNSGWRTAAYQNQLLREAVSEYGLCQIYRNEPWHYELRPEAIDHGCPAMYADPAHDPRMQQ